MELLLQFGVTKVILSAVLALLAYSAQRLLNRPHVSYGLWLIVLATMIVPSVVGIPATDLLRFFSPSDLLKVATEAASGNGAELYASVPLGIGVGGVVALTWIAGSLVVLLLTLARIRRFHRFFTTNSSAAPERVQLLAADVATQLGLASAPAVRVINATVSPLVWFVGGDVRVLLPTALLAEIDDTQLRFVLAHELAHVRRRDHFVRWLEWATCVAFWWNPIAWWARRNIRAAEELCCDALVLTLSPAHPRHYAGSLLAVVQFLSTQRTLPLPAIAMRAVSDQRAHALKDRFTMIVERTSNLSVSRTARFAQNISATLLFTLGLLHPVRAQDPLINAQKLPACDTRADKNACEIDRVKFAAARIKSAIESGKITPASGERKLADLRRKLEYRLEVDEKLKSEYQQEPEYTRKPGYKGKPAFKEKPEYKAKPEFKEKPEFKDKPEYKDKPEFKEKPAFKEKPEYKQKPEFKAKPEFKEKPAFKEKPEFKGKPEFKQKPEDKSHLDYKELAKIKSKADYEELLDRKRKSQFKKYN